MNFYDDYGDEAIDHRLPQRVYARIDSTEPDFLVSEQPQTALFDAIDAEFVDSDRFTSGSIREGALDKVVSVLETNISEIGPLPKDAYAGEDPAWFEFNLAEEDGGAASLLQYPNLFAPPVRRSATFKRLSPAESQRLTAQLDFDHFHDANEEDIRAAIHTTGSAGAGVYDVGQGNCNAVLNAAGQPLLYYDLGGGVLGNASTYPAGLNNFCFSQAPSIVMSHWDWDHWSLALRIRSNATSAARGPGYGDALGATWIVPRQRTRLGAVHRGFLAKLSRVLVWPESLPFLNVGPVTVHKCPGPASNRNHSGLAMTFRPSWARGDGILFTGDCDYRYLPTSCTQATAYDGLVPPHHGGPLHPASPVPPPTAAGPYRRLCYSTGAGNTYNHPAPATGAAHHAAGWTASSTRDTRVRLAMLNNQAAGHIWIQPAGPPLGGPNCGFSYCQTGFTQS